MDDQAASPPNTPRRTGGRSDGAEDAVAAAAKPAAIRTRAYGAPKALAEGPARFPASGFLYFPYSGKAEKIKSLELIYDGTSAQ